MEALDNASVHYVDSWDDAQDLLAWLGQPREFLGIDTETTGLNVGKDRIRLVQFGDRTDGWALDYSKWRGLVEEVVKRYDRPYVAHNLIFDGKFLEKDGITIPQHLANDTMIMAHLLDPRYSVALKSLAARHVDKRAKMGQDLLGEAFRKGGWDWGSVPTSLDSYWLYSAMDTILTAMLAEKLWPKVQPFRRVYDVEMACIHVLREAGITGMEIDLPYVEAKRAEYIAELARLAAMIPVAPSKDADVREWLLSHGAVLIVRTEKGALSVEDDVLASLETQFPEFITPLRRWRKLSRVVSSYFNNFMSMHDHGILRPHIKVVGARTARMSITDPALQTLPRGTAVRDAFIAREGQTLILADYQQAELRVLASYAQEESMMDAFARGEDLHKWVASHAYHGGDIEKVTKLQRQVSKNTQFARLYGAGEAKIAVTAGVTVEVIQDFLIRYNELFPGVAEFMEGTIEHVQRSTFAGDKRFGYVDTILGRRLPVEHNKAYKGVNYMIQSSATADLLKLKLVELDAAGLGKYIRLPVHDEIIFEAPDDEVDEVVKVIEDVMPETKLFKCRLDIDVETTKRWGSKYAEYGE